MSDGRGDEPAGPGGGATCCAMRRKVVVGILGVLPEAQCGVPDSELADFMRFDLEAPGGKPVIAFRFCPWCGAPRAPDGEVRIVDVRLVAGAPDESGELEPPGDDDGSGEGPAWEPPRELEP